MKNYRLINNISGWAVFSLFSQTRNRKWVKKLAKNWRVTIPIT